ncbi:hypothetical protein MTR67_013682 [Solanum verrucosum]|uniref:F-box domain-containing protein n=1 Tax=Solanum verrucosum TaxID=315347 RepID=A0AAF0QCC8_SOLVR|nr:hypothetical protein MTR67_013682 [Solanum verrucosum]
MELTNLKKQNVTEEEAPKGISKLPHPLLVEIFSLLPTEDAFRTCVISKEWQRLSTLIHSFNFTYREREDFSLIHNALAHALSPKIKKFQLDFTHLCLSDCSFRTEYETLTVVELDIETYGLLYAFLQSSCQVFKVMCMLQFNGVPVSELNCKYLTLVLHMKNFNMYGVAGLLRASPHVETMQLDDFPFYFLNNFRCKSELLDLAKGDNMDLLSGVSSVEHHNLKKVKIVISSEACLKDHVKRGFEKVSKLLEFLLLNALVFGEFRYRIKEKKVRDMFN